MRLLKPFARRRPRGLTLIEVMIGLAITVVLMSLALPSMLGTLQRQRLKSAAEGLAMDISEARFEAARRGIPIELGFATGTDWCWSTATRTGCDCHVRQSCQLKSVRAAEMPSVELVDAQGALFMPDNAARTTGGTALLQTPGGDRLRVELSGMGRARICAPERSIAPYPNC